MKKLLLLTLAILPCVVSAQDKNDGATWNLICNQGTRVDQAICDTLVYGYLEGVRVQSGFANFRPPYCMPKSTTIGDASGVFAKYLAEHPEQHSLPLATMLTLAMTQAFLCK